MTRALSPEQLLAIADEFCAAYKVRIRSFPALAACAAVPGARIHGVPVCGSEREAGLSLYDAILHLKPLTSHNTDFAAIARDVYLRWADG
ncbi:TetR family transcriptional regulator [Corynebacterium sp. TA-R-1]|uniref:TetR family transcriptional regulator n=1 Tax=Corynebacterium stercoris TaxID=2943490 RepID=A0ABT1G385_9CORY|nr:TetR family transcriptional regulator [Corynebacterium stercoris]MCP1388482.1 TetR family transcriptional regulator [Corynebacterium stercoris]